MKRIETHFDHALEQLACDELLLDQCDRSPNEGLIRFWEVQGYCVVLGYGNRADSEVYLDRCREAEVPVFRRCSGGGTVLLGPGCLNYSLTLPLNLCKALGSVGDANSFIMERNRAAVGDLVSGSVSVQGCTDLVWDGVKISGNAQRRRRAALLFHGTFLLDFDLSRMDRFLRLPSREPQYRGGRAHSVFAGNLPVPRDRLVDALCETWAVQGRGHVATEHVIKRAQGLRQNGRCLRLDV